MMSTESILDRLHDATLRHVHLDWETGDVCLDLRAALGPASATSSVKLHLRDVSTMRCPRRKPWGMSTSINEVRSKLMGDGRTDVTIEMQSGDVLEFEAKAATAEVVA